MKLKDISSETWNFIIDHEEKLEQGIHLWYKGVPFPRRVYYNKNKGTTDFSRTLEALGIVKKYFFALTFLKSVVIPRSFSVKRYDTFLLYLFTLVDWSLSEFWIKNEEFSVPVGELGKFVNNFMFNLGFTTDVSQKYSRLVMMILEFDNAYRYRVQDLFEKKLYIYWRLKPSKFIKLVLETYKKRELNAGAADKILRIGKILYWILKIPKFKKAWIQATANINYSNIRLDKNDLYHTSYWVGYEFGGKPWNQRYKVFEKAHKNGFPPYHKRDEGNITNFLTGN